MKLTSKIALRAVGDIMFPRKCCVCGRELLLSEDAVCMTCLVNLPCTLFETFSRNPMADKLNALLTEASPYYVLGCSLFYYRGEYREITPSIKYFGNFSGGRYFGKLLGQRLSSSVAFKDVDYIIPVPLHWTRRWKRGYNQAEIIARAVGECFPGVVVDSKGLRRVRRTCSQAQIKREYKTANVAGAFKLGSCLKTKCRLYRHILVVDDVFTTGHTLAECWRALAEGMEKEGVRISVATLAYAGV